MRHLLLFEAYGDIYSDIGTSHIIYDIDDNYVLKSPRTFNLAKDDISAFKEHINFMKAHPNIFPNVKLLSNKRASVEKMDTKKALDDIEHIYKVFVPQLKKIHPSLIIEKHYIIWEIYENEKLYILFSLINDEIFKKWKIFLDLVRKEMSEIEKEGHVTDLNSGNFGIDKYGNIKLIDY